MLRIDKLDRKTRTLRRRFFALTSQCLLVNPRQGEKDALRVIAQRLEQILAGRDSQGTLDQDLLQSLETDMFRLRRQLSRYPWSPAAQNSFGQALSTLKDRYREDRPTTPGLGLSLSLLGASELPRTVN